VSRELADPAIWAEPNRAQQLGKERVQLEKTVNQLINVEQQLQDAKEWLDLVAKEQDLAALQELTQEIKQINNVVAKLEFQRMFAGTMDSHNAFLEIQSGSGGTEAQDWAEMLLRMYLRWLERKGFTASLMEVSTGEVAGIKSATIKVTGEYAFGWLRTETGVHRLVRKSPFDAGNRRHTSFASIFVSPEVDDDIDINLNTADLRIDTYRSSGAGGQHLNTTDSAIRITHLPTKTVVQCQSERSQHQNRAQAMSQLRAKLYELAIQQRRQEQQQLENVKADIGWGSQIRSYVLDQSRIKDLRTGYENTNTTAVLDGDLDDFIEASLKSGL